MIDADQLQEWTTEELQKRKSFVLLIVGILVGLLAVSVGMGIVTGNPALMVSAVALAVVGLPMTINVGRINAELRSRTEDG